MKKAVALILAVLMVSFSVAGCNKNKDTNSNSTSIGSNSSGKVVTLKAIMLKHPLTKDLTTMEWLTKIEKDAGVNIQWQQISSDWDQKKGAMLAGGDIPDLIIGAGAINDSDFSQFQGLFEDMTPLIQKDAPNIQKMFAEKPILKQLAETSEGKIYGLPKYQRYWPLTGVRQFINKQWLDKLGLKEPTTWDELYNVLVEFKTKDPNGNGKADEIPLDWAPGTGGFNVAVMLGGEGITTSLLGRGDGYYVENGVVKNYFADTRYKTLVKFLNKCWNAGLIDPAVFTNDYTTYQSIARGSGDMAKVGFTWGWELTDRFGATIYKQYESLAPLKPTADYSGPVSWSYDYNILNYGANMAEMSAKCKNKDAAMKFLDQFYNPVNSIQVLFGSIGPNIKDNGDGSYSILPPTDSKMDPGTWKWTSTMADDGPMYIADSLNLTLGTDMQDVARQTQPFDPVLKSITDKDVWPMPFIKMNSADNNQVALLATNVNNLTSTKWANWIEKGGVDQQWDQYISDLNKAGLQKIIQIMQKYYDDYEKSGK